MARSTWGAVAWRSQGINWQRFEGVTLCSCKRVNSQQSSGVKDWNVTICSLRGSAACGPRDTHRTIYLPPAVICLCSLWVPLEGVFRRDCSLVSPLAQAGLILLVRDMDTGSGRYTE